VRAETIRFTLCLQVTAGATGHVPPGAGRPVPAHRLWDVCQHVLHHAGAYCGLRRGILGEPGD
jgi:hypothetical protein